VFFIQLTKNEKKTLKLLLKNSRITDIQIASELKISSQAVGKIRKKLELSVIESYTINLNYYKLEIQTFAVTVAKLTRDGLDKGELEVEQCFLKNPHIIRVYRVPQGSSTHIIMYGFKDMNELDSFFHSVKMKNELHRFIETQNIYTFSYSSLIKNSPLQLFNKAIDELGTKVSEIKFNEIESFKRRLR